MREGKLGTFARDIEPFIIQTGTRLISVNINSIVLYAAGGASFYPVTDAGLTDAVAAAVSGDRLTIPSGTFTSTYTFPDGVSVYGVGGRVEFTNVVTVGTCGLYDLYFTLTGSSSTGVYPVAVTAGKTATFKRCVITCETSGANGYGIYIGAPSGVAIVDDCYISVTAATNASGIDGQSGSPDPALYIYFTRFNLQNATNKYQWRGAPLQESFAIHSNVVLVNENPTPEYSDLSQSFLDYSNGPYHASDIRNDRFIHHVPIPSGTAMMLVSTELTPSSGEYTWIAQSFEDTAAHYSEADVSNPPTYSDIGNAFAGWDSIPSGFVGVINDNGAGTDIWLCTYAGTGWYYTQMTAAVE